MVDKKVLTKKEKIFRGKDIRKLVDSDGWKYLKEWLENGIEVNKTNLYVTSTNRNIDINIKNQLMTEFGFKMKAYRAVLDKPDEWIKMMNEELKKEENK